MIEILQIEDSTRQTLSEMDSTEQKNFSSINYVSYDKKKSKSKKKTQTNPNHSSSSSRGQKQDSTVPGKQCFQCKKPYTKGHKNVCKALNSTCNACGIKGHYQIACKKSGNFPQKPHSNPQNSSSTGRMNIAAAVKETPLNADFFDEKGLPKEYRPRQPKKINVLSLTSNDKPIMIEFGCGLTPLSFNRKLVMQADTGVGANAINKKTFDELFPDVELEESTFCLQNFDKRLIKPIGSFRCFLRWKGHKYRVRIEVMGIDTPNLLSRETTFLMSILKKCLSAEKVPTEQVTPNNAENPIPIPISVPDPTPGHSRHTVPSMEGVFSHSVMSVEENSPCHSVLSTEGGSQMNYASISEMAESPETQNSSNSGSTKPSLSVVDLPLTQEKVETTYADVFQGLGKFQGDPYKLRLKPDAVPVKQRPRKVPVHLQDAFHEEVE